MNEFLLPLGSVPHLTAWRTLWRDGLDQRSFAKQPCSLICRRRTATVGDTRGARSRSVCRNSGA